jgi:hypothetical protein
MATPKADYGYVPPKAKSEETLYEDAKDVKTRQQKGVSFAPHLEEVQYQHQQDLHRESQHSLSEYYDSYVEEGQQPSYQLPPLNEQGKPVFASRGSSLKNLETLGHKMSDDYQDATPAQERKIEPRLESRPEVRMEARPIEQKVEPRSEPRMESRPDDRYNIVAEPSTDAPEVKVLNHRFEPVGRAETVPMRKVDSKFDPPVRSNSGEIRYDARERIPALAPKSSMEQFRGGLDIQERVELSDSPQMHYGVSRHASQKAQVMVDKVAKVPTLHSTTQTDSYEVDSLRAELARLRGELEESREESRKLKDLMGEQKRGFDKLSAQAYKKIKELLTDRNIMSIEIKSLKSQVCLFDSDGPNGNSISIMGKCRGYRAINSLLYINLLRNLFQVVFLQLHVVFEDSNSANMIQYFYHNSILWFLQVDLVLFVYELGH